MSDTPALSIIVPTYNRGNLLIPTIESLINQTSSDFEIIIVDDGSTDNTKLKVVELISENKNVDIRYFAITNRERGAARNFGTSVAKGAYVNFFDSDDIAYPNHVALFKKLKTTNNSLNTFAVSYDIKNAKGRLLRSIVLQKQVSDFIYSGNDLSCNGVFIKREIAAQNPFSELRELSGSEDYELWLRLAAKYEFPCFPDISHSVIQHDERSTMNFNPEPLIKRKLLMLDIAYSDEAVLNRFGAFKNEMKSSAYSYIALHIAMTNKSKNLALRWFGKSINTYPRSLFNRRTLAIIKHLLT